MDELRNNTISQEMLLDEISYGEEMCQEFANDYYDLVNEGIEPNLRY